MQSYFFSTEYSGFLTERICLPTGQDSEQDQLIGLIKQDLESLDCFVGGTNTYSTHFRQLEGQPVWLYCHGRHVKCSDVEYSSIKRVLPQSEVKVESSDLGECHDHTHEEKHLLLAPFFCDNNKLSHRAQHWPPTLHTATVLSMRSKLGSLTASDPEMPILFTGGKGALVRGTMYEENTWTVRLFYGLKAAYPHISFSCPLLDHVATKTAFSCLMIKHTGLNGYESVFPFHGVPDILAYCNILSVDPADALEDTLQAHKQDVVPPKVGQLIAYLHISALFSILKSLLHSSPSSNPVSAKGLLVYKQIGCTKVVLTLRLANTAGITSIPRGMNVAVYIEDVSILNERSLCASISDWVE